jgi:choline dehydrogenase-like flavoprotein
MTSKTGADVVIAGTGIVGCLIAEQMLDAGLSVPASQRRVRATLFDPLREPFRTFYGTRG